ncbi:winged helix-turn-helix domain-containing protein [Aquabacterium sp. J223]|uniref:winged helix-turn-helix domain-containing protein n=1 Tax=Aquabacterium sp. J223 TaxID=2898431 RepID=UPI0021AD831A|nr:winged helix-turn-helix domain-containing protein [Aquabacterium sp. J223]UUX97269.1 winged helix-turn-helix domain-containing protein [Aquabacterium sp. J223]
MARDKDASRASVDPTPLRVGRWRVDPATDSIALDGRTCKLEPRTMRLLLVLAARPGDVLRSDELLDAVWPGVVVTGQSLYQAVGELRSMLKADAATGEFIANVPRKGYRLVAPVARLPDAVASATPAPPPLDARQTIAVLPFRDLGLSAALGFLRETLLAGLVLELSRQPNLAPIARGTMLSYADRPVPPRQVAADLGVRYVLDGTMAQLGDELHIGCELVDARSEAVVASEAMRLPVGEWPALTQHVVGRLARAARLQLSDHASSTVDASPADGVSALQLSRRAWVELYCRPQTRQTNDRAWRWALEAVQRDGSVGAAWNALGYCEWRAAQYGWSERDRGALLDDAVAHAQQATVLAPSDPDACYTLGLVTYTRGELERGAANLRHCLDISASYAPAHGMLGLVRAVQGHPEETAELCRRAFALSPREPLRATWHWTEACALSMLGRDAEAFERACLGIAANPDYPACYLVAAVAARRLGKSDEAARYATVLRGGAFHSIARLRAMLPPMRVEPWASRFLEDLEAAGVPAR